MSIIIHKFSPINLLNVNYISYFTKRPNHIAQLIFLSFIIGTHVIDNNIMVTNH